jgi:branched-chain amino acid transport system permease protein
MATLFFVQVLVNGLTIGAIYVMMALGFTLIFGIVRIVNFTHGEFYMLAAFMVYMLYGVWGILSYLPAVMISAVLVGLLGMAYERNILRRVRGKDLQCLIITAAAAVGLQQIAALIWGAEELSIPAPYKGTVQWQNFVFPLDRIIVVGYTIAFLLAFYLILKKTKFGLAMEAVVQDKEAAEIQGIRVNYIYSISFGIGAFLAGAAGGLVGPVFSLNPYIGAEPLIKAFMAVILGGLGNVTGAVMGGLIIGISESFLTTYFGGAVASITVFIVIMIILLVKPSGLFGEVGT